MSDQAEANCWVKVKRGKQLWKKKKKGDSYWQKNKYHHSNQHQSNNRHSNIHHSNNHHSIDEGWASSSSHHYNEDRQYLDNKKTYEFSKSKRKRILSKTDDSDTLMSSSSKGTNDIKGLSQPLFESERSDSTKSLQVVCTSASSEIQSSLSSAKKSVRNIPGFHFDPDKKRYFRLVPGHNNLNPMTREGLDKKKAETKRQEMLSGNLKDERKQFIGSEALCTLHRHVQHGQLSSQQFVRYARERAVRVLSSRPVELVGFPDEYSVSGEISFLQIDRRQRNILMVISNTYLSRVWQGTIASDPSKPRSLAISNWKVVNCLGTTQGKITNANWVSSDKSEDLHVLYSISGGPLSSVQLLKCSKVGEGYDRIMYSYKSSRESAWTCARSTNPLNPSYLSIGSSKKAIVVDIDSARKWKIFTNHSDVLSQAFSSMTPILYNGTRRGEVLGCDLRSMTNTKADISLRLKHDIAVCSILLLRDPNYIVASDMSGQIKLWDIRQCRCVKEYKGHYNKYANVPLSLDSTESILYGVGQDSCTRLWSVRDCHLLRTIPCPQPASHLPPSVVYSSDWYGGVSSPGLILGIDRCLYWYSV